MPKHPGFAKPIRAPFLCAREKAAVVGGGGEEDGMRSEGAAAPG